jgi:hypothetical protein
MPVVELANGKAVFRRNRLCLDSFARLNNHLSAEWAGTTMKRLKLSHSIFDVRDACSAGCLSVFRLHATKQRVLDSENWSCVNLILTN